MTDRSQAIRLEVPHLVVPQDMSEWAVAATYDDYIPGAELYRGYVLRILTAQHDRGIPPGDILIDEAIGDSVLFINTVCKSPVVWITGWSPGWYLTLHADTFPDGRRRLAMAYQDEPKSLARISSRLG